MSKKIAIVVWSKTGNTRLMSKAIKEGAESKGAEVEVFKAYNFDIDAAKSYDCIALGCPAMGAEVLEETEFQPFYDSIKGSLSGKKVALFGSYDWGDGEWMRIWQDDVKDTGASLVKDGLITNLAPDDNAVDECKSLGEALFKA